MVDILGTSIWINCFKSPSQKKQKKKEKSKAFLRLGWDSIPMDGSGCQKRWIFRKIPNDLWDHPCTDWRVFKSSCCQALFHFRIRSKEAQKEEANENVSTFSVLSSDGHIFFWGGFVLVRASTAFTASSLRDWSMLYVSSYLGNENFKTL